MYQKKMCGCKKCTLEDLKQGRICEKPNIEEYPKFVLLNPNHEIAAQFQHTYGEQKNLFLMTEEIYKKFRSCSFQTWFYLNCEIDGRSQRMRRGAKQDIRDIVMELCMKFAFHTLLSLHIESIPQLSELLFTTMRVSWFNFEPIRFIATHRLSNLYPDVLKQWDDYAEQFKKYCSERNLRDYAGILFNEDSDNVFIIEIDEQYNEMTLSDISLLRDTLCNVLGCGAVSVHLITVRKGSLLLSFCYCLDDYISKFENLTPRQLRSLAEVKLCQITRLKDKNDKFDYKEIQSYKVCYLFVIILILHLI